MAALRSLTDEDRAELQADLAVCRRLRARIVGALKRHPTSWPLPRQLEALDKYIGIYERELERSAT